MWNAYLEWQQSGCLSWWTILGQAISFHVLFIVFALHWYLLIELGSIYEPIVIGFNTIAVIRYRRFLTLLAPCPIWRGATLNLVRMRLLSIRTVIFYARMDKMYGLLLTTFIAFNVPLSGTIFVDQFINQNHYGWLVRITFVTIMMGLASVIVFYHFIAARNSQMLHSPYKQFMSRLMTVSSMRTRLRVKLACHVQAFHTDTRYGITYAGMALISYAALVKVTFDFLF